MIKKLKDIKLLSINYKIVFNNKIIFNIHLIQNPRISSALRMPGVSTSATSGFVLFLRITDLLLLQPPMKTYNINIYDAFDYFFKQ